MGGIQGIHVGPRDPALNIHHVLQLDRSWPVGPKLALGKGIGNGNISGSSGSEAAAGSAAAAAMQVGSHLAGRRALNPQRVRRTVS